MNTLLIVGVLVTIFCMWLLSHVLHSYKQAVASKGWPCVKGKITEIDRWGRRNINGTVNFANEHPANSDLWVYYRPDKPDESVLIPGPRPGNKRYSDIILASIGLVVGIGLAAWGTVDAIS